MLWLDGVPASALPLPDRGLDFGDGLFETLLLKQGRPLYRELHMERLHLGLQRLGFPDCLELARVHLDRAIEDLCDRPWAWCALRVTVSRGAGPRGYAPPSPTSPRIIISAVLLDRDCSVMQAAAQVTLASLRWGSQPALAGLKHLNRLEQVLAAKEYRDAGRDEAVMLDQAGLAVSMTAGNLFIVQGGELITPPIQDCGIAGTRRRLVLERWAPAVGLSAREAVLSLEEVEAATEVFFSNSLVGLRPVASFHNSRWVSHEICESLYKQYRSELT